MTKEVYDALKTRITVTAKAVQIWRWEFSNEGLNDGIDCMDDRFIDPMIQDFKTGRITMWNIAQHVFMLLRLFHQDQVEDLEARLIANPLKK